VCSAFSSTAKRHHHPDVHRADPARREHHLVAFSVFLGDLVGQVFALFVLTVAAAEAAIGLAILVVYFETAAPSRSRTSI
jgi:hypothetical protein